MKMISFDQLLNQVVIDTTKDRVEQWAKYYFEKELLPALIDECTKRVRCEIFSNANIPEEIRLRVVFEKSEIKK